MSEKRMFSKQITESDAFLEMPLSTQALYFHLGMAADDDGFINAPKRIQRGVGGSEDDLKLLIAKNFIIPFDSGVVVIKHWKINNYIRSDRYKETAYTEEKSRLSLKENGVYTLLGIPSDYQMDTAWEPSGSIEQNRLDKNRLNKSSCSKGDIDFLELLSDEEIARLKSLFKDHYELMDECQTDANRKNKEIHSPFSYIVGYAQNVGWPERREKKQ